MKTGIVKDWRYLEHEMGPFHPENPLRLDIIYKMIESELSLSSYAMIEPQPAKEEEIELVHAPSYVKSIKGTSGEKRTYLDPDTSTSARTYEIALLAAGGLLKGVDLALEGKIQNGFALVRPPGHHAEASQAMGFCIFNNIAIAAQYLIQKHSLKRVLIVDWDLHHGNGTQHAFYSRDDVLFFSTHQFPHYPGSGDWDETGEGHGESFTVNVPLSPGKTDSDFLFIYQNILMPIAAKYKPEFILVSAGFDIFDGDPLGAMRVTPEGFGAMTSELLTLARDYSQDRIFFTLEGGYNLRGLKDGVREVLFQLGGKKKKPALEVQISESTKRELAPAFEILKKYW